MTGSLLSEPHEAHDGRGKSKHPNRHREKRCDVAIPWRTETMRTFRDCHATLSLAMTAVLFVESTWHGSPESRPTVLRYTVCGLRCAV
ncbi:MAG: hypothetical protein V7640_1728 [Betaproteobacteria bacterium]